MKARRVARAGNDLPACSALLSLLAFAGGSPGPTRDQPDRPVLLSALVFSLVVGILVADWRDPDVADGRFVRGKCSSAPALSVDCRCSATTGSTVGSPLIG